MVFTHEMIIQDKYLRHAAEVAEVSAQYERGRLMDDASQVQAATDRLTELKQQRMAMDALVYEQQAQQQQAQPQNRHGLSADEVDVAKASGITEEEYARNRAKMNSMKNQGYWSQGRVFK